MAVVLLQHSSAKRLLICTLSVKPVCFLGQRQVFCETRRQKGARQPERYGGVRRESNHVHGSYRKNRLFFINTVVAFSLTSWF